MKKISVLLIMMFAVALVPAYAQLGGIIGKAVSKGVEKAVEKTVEKTIEKEVEKQAEKITEKILEQTEQTAAALDSLNKSVEDLNEVLNEANEALIEEQEQLEAEQQAAKDKNTGKTTGAANTSQYNAINAERKAANAKLTYDRWDY